MDKNQIFLFAVTACGAAVTFMITWVGVKYRAWIIEKIGNDRAEGMLLRLGDFAFRVVNELNQTVVDKLKAEGKWTEEAAQDAKNQAMAKLKSYLGVEGLKELGRILGLDLSGVEKLLASYIESEVAQAKVVA
jgi:hypothetical protein